MVVTRALDCDDLLTRPTEPREVVLARRQIELQTLEAANSPRVTVKDLTLALLRAYDLTFFNGALDRGMKARKYRLVIRTDDTTTRGRSSFRPRFVVDRPRQTIEMVMDVSFDRDAAVTPNSPLRIAGVVCSSPLRCLMVQVEHQVVHLIQDLACGGVSYGTAGAGGRQILDALPHTPRYRAIARNIFALRLPSHGRLHGKRITSQGGMDSTGVASHLRSFDDMFKSPDEDEDARVVDSFSDTPLASRMRFLRQRMGKGVYYYDSTLRSWLGDGRLVAFRGDLAVVRDSGGTERALAPPMVAPRYGGESDAAPVADLDFYDAALFPRQMACLATSRMGAQAASAAAEDFLSRSLRRANPLRYYRPVVLVTGLTDDGRFGVVQGRRVPVEHLVPAWFVGRASRNRA